MINRLSLLVAISIFLAGFLYSANSNAGAKILCSKVQTNTCVNGFVSFNNFRIDERGIFYVDVNRGRSGQIWVQISEAVPAGREAISIEVFPSSNGPQNQSVIIYYK